MKKKIKLDKYEQSVKKSRKPVHPGNVFLHDVLIPLEFTVTKAARMMGITRKALSELVNEKSSCTVQMALRIAKVTRTSAESWLAMQLKLDLWKARQKKLAPLLEFPKVAI
ncbi:MAG: HigA family addiction module antitoxin [Spirochaetaceae bacterium]|nr:HigA family addiction module antitoxin [Spirochaetaceae bacterium]